MTFLYLLWLLVNLGLIAWSLIAWYRCLVFFGQRFSRVTAVVLGLVMLTTCVNTNAPSDKPLLTERAHPVEFPVSVLSVDQPVQHEVRLLALPFCHLSQTIHIAPVRAYANRVNSVEVNQYVHLSGLQTGLGWQPASMVVNPLPGRRIGYTVAGMLSWKLFSIPVYSQPLTYRGTFSIDKPSS